MNKRLTAIILCVIIAISSMLTLSACKPETFTVTFNKGGTEDMVITVMEGYENIPEVQTVSSWTEIVFPVYICENHTFSGWSEVIHLIEKDTVITAIWTQNPFVVKFDPVNPEAKYVSGELSQTVHNWAGVKTPEYTLPGYTLTWEEWDVRKTDDTTIKAVWIPGEYTLEFVDDDGTKLDYEKVGVTYQQQISKLPVPAKEGKRFGGWYLEEDVSQYIYEGDIWRKAGDAILKARWLEPDQYRITYKNAFDIKGEIAYRSTDETFVINTPTRYGYDFLGWTGTGVGDEPVSKVEVKKGSSIDIELTAHWKAKQRTLTLNPDGGELSQTTKSIIFGEKIGTLPTDIKKDGYEFVGWITPNGTLVTEDTEWIWDPDNVSSLKAVYLRLYTVKLILKGIAPDNESKTILANFTEDAEEQFGLVKSKTEENVWVFERIFKEGERIGELPFKEHMILDDGDYKFSSWAVNGSGIKVTSADIVNETKFEGSKESGIIELYIKIARLWSPVYGT